MQAYDSERPPDKAPEILLPQHQRDLQERSGLTQEVSRNGAIGQSPTRRSCASSALASRG
jgi:hypothetical protein